MKCMQVAIKLETDAAVAHSSQANEAWLLYGSKQRQEPPLSKPF